jgi:hypothetical protein
MRKTQATKEQSELRQLCQACFHLLASERDEIRELCWRLFVCGRTLHSQEIIHKEGRRLSLCEHCRILISSSIWAARVFFFGQFYLGYSR